MNVLSGVVLIGFLSVREAAIPAIGVGGVGAMLTPARNLMV